MKFNKYIWELYCNSEEGNQKIKDSKAVDVFSHEEAVMVAFEPEALLQLRSLGLDAFIQNDLVNLQKLYHECFLEREFSIEQADEIFTKWVEEGLVFKGYTLIEKEEYSRWMEEIETISNALYAAFPDFFFPYFFLHNFDEFQVICLEFEIPLPEIPPKKNKKDRVLYYLHICKAVYEFRQANKLSPDECIAFFYDFALNAMEWSSIADEPLPSPSKVWYVGAGPIDHSFIDTATQESVDRWQCHPDTRPGDIIVMYCWSPRSYIHSVWRAVSNGFVDPFFYYYRIAYISKPIKVSPISFKEIKANPVLSKSPIVRNSFQGVNGYPITYEEYMEMLRLWKNGGMDINILPKIEPIIGLSEEVVLADERDVEVHLVEPILIRLGYTEKDWIRQMPVKMGRGVRYYPDYCFDAVAKRGDEKATMILEAKYSIKNQKALQDAFFQAKSYAVRLRCECFILAAKEGLWIYQSVKSDFKFGRFEHYTWNELNAPDAFHHVLKSVGKKNK